MQANHSCDVCTERTIEYPGTSTPLSRQFFTRKDCDLLTATQP
jgi:hypothetical protein